jgi:imidazolonepropionase-like amidohydrolase
MDKIALTNVRTAHLMPSSTAAGGTLLPGLIDTHVHVDKVSQLEASASWGVTTMLDMGNKDLANLAKLKNGQRLPTLRSADLVLVDGDPTLDISATRNIRGVWIGGLRAKQHLPSRAL